jgi:hypothetical protein
LLDSEEGKTVRLSFELVCLQVFTTALVEQTNMDYLLRLLHTFLLFVTTLEATRQFVFDLILLF